MDFSTWKKLRSVVENKLLRITPEDADILIPKKEEITKMKVMTHSGNHVMIYFCGANPILFELENRIIPTVYTLWKFPNLLSTVTTWTPVFEKLMGGADLMLPGIVRRTSECLSTLRSLKESDICAVTLYGNKTPIAVGTCVVSGDELASVDAKGKAVRIYHLYADLLWSHGDRSEPPFLEETEDTADSQNDEFYACDTNHDEMSSNNVADRDNCPEQYETKKCEYHEKPQTLTNSQGFEMVKGFEDLTIQEGDPMCENLPENTNVEEQQNASNNSLTEEIDCLLKECFFTALKILGKKIKLPILTSIFYRTHVLAACPPGCQLDIKKSSFKKLSTFLKEMEKIGVIVVKEMSKGVENIVSINIEHRELIYFKPNPAFEMQLKNFQCGAMGCSNKVVNHLPSIRELHTVTVAVLPLFKPQNYSKGAAVAASDIRKVLTNYVKSNNLQDSENQRNVILDPLLADVALKKGEGNVTLLSWEDLICRCISKMRPAYEVVFPGQQPVLYKGELQPIEIVVVQRSGNKKVTLLYNLETFGIDPTKLAHQIQVGIAASTSVGPSVTKKGTQVLVQGNQVRYVAKLLLDEYKVPRKYIKGLDSAPKEKKK
ncbi:eukaryotic translation initiation factor 2D-like [Limulus polyphemus]|uniref:Eukaryotic translation initiation factor 2D-like n=1 Tax=Limulus polyphemus TaxID=6850 RepID=A0ABM1BJN4_LIMPO|nr:eukaryotic translation initiation factor 2D-like [Limulus polyphemus]